MLVSTSLRIETTPTTSSSTSLIPRYFCTPHTRVVGLTLHRSRSRALPLCVSPSLYLSISLSLSHAHTLSARRSLIACVASLAASLQGTLSRQRHLERAISTQSDEKSAAVLLAELYVRVRVYVSACVCVGSVCYQMT
jgi:hypothetical protein